MFEYDSENESEILRRLDELRAYLDLPSRGHVVEFAVLRRTAVIEFYCTGASGAPPLEIPGEHDPRCRCNTSVARARSSAELRELIAKRLIPNFGNQTFESDPR